MKQAQRVAKELPAETLDMLFLSSGSGPSKQRVESSEGVEQDLAISYLSRFVTVRGVASRREVLKVKNILACGTGSRHHR